MTVSPIRVCFIGRAIRTTGCALSLSHPAITKVHVAGNWKRRCPRGAVGGRRTQLSSSWGGLRAKAHLLQPPQSVFLAWRCFGGGLGRAGCDQALCPNTSCSLHPSSPPGKLLGHDDKSPRQSPSAKRVTCPALTPGHVHALSLRGGAFEPPSSSKMVCPRQTSAHLVSKLHRVPVATLTTKSNALKKLYVKEFSLQPIYCKFLQAIACD